MIIAISLLSVFSIILLLLISILVIYIIIQNKKIKQKSRSDFSTAQSQLRAELDAWKQQELQVIEEALSQRRIEIAAEIKNLEADAREEQLQRLENQRREVEAQNYLLESKKEACDEAVQMYEKRRAEVEEHYSTLWKIADERYQQRITDYEEQIKALQLRHSEKQKALEQSLIDKEQLLLTQQAAVLKEAADALKTQLDKETAEYVTHTQNLRLAADNELNLIKQEIEDFKKKQQVINEEIMRRRQVEEQQDFYRVLLSEQDKEDIHYLISIIGNIRNKQLLYKLIWSEYLQKPFNEMLKRVLEGKEVRCVIYKITNLKTGEIYIGKTKAEASKRWTEHIKTSLNIGTIARSKIHIMLFGHWDEFSFEILEKVSDESLLSSREKFYINFYQSNIYGYNMNSGG